MKYLESKLENLKFENYELKIKNNVLFENVNLTFENRAVSHILGNNGSGKSSFGKSCVGMLPYKGLIIGNEKTILIGSSSNVPSEFYISDISQLLKKRFDNTRVDMLYELLKLDNISETLVIRKMSDGQKQKVKLYAFLSAEVDVIILDEFTNALDKNSSLDLYDFINEYSKNFGGTIINITHNLSDLEYMAGNYYYVSQKNMVRISSKQEVIDRYIKGE